MLRAYTMMDSQQPCVEVAENDVDHGKVCLDIRMIPLDRKWIVAVSELGEVVVAGPAICADKGTWGHCLKNEGF